MTSRMSGAVRQQFRREIRDGLYKPDFALRHGFIGHIGRRQRRKVILLVSDINASG
jgi:hypothetical protein